MGLIGKTLQMITNKRLRGFDKATADAEASQMKVFSDLLNKARNTEWGKKFGFGDLTSPETFRLRVPLTDYEEMRPIWHRAFQGDRDVTWPGHVRFFALSSGTTSGDKLLPVTRDAIRSNRRSGADLIAFLVRLAGPDALVKGQFFYLGGTTTLREKGKSLYGDASGIMARHIPFYARRHHLPDRDIACISNWEEKIAKSVRRYLTADVAALSACPSWAAMLFKEMIAAAQKAGKPDMTVGELWPRLTFFVSYGMAFAPYKKAFNEYIGREIHLLDTYSSSEGGMNAIEDPDGGGAMRLIVDNGTFFEFVPADQMDREQPPRLHIGEVETGVDYSVVLNTNGGIWAYPVGDLVRFTTLSPPRIVFASRTQVQLSAFGEHVSGEEMEIAMAAACDATDAVVADFTVFPRYPGPDHPIPAHRWIVEFDRPPSSEQAFMETIDRTIRAANEDYDTHRTDNYGMTPPSLIAVPPKTFFAWMKSKGKLGGQHKVPRVATRDNMGEELLEIAGGLSN